MGLNQSTLVAWAGATATNTITSASFTPAANSLVVVATGCGNAAGVTVTGITCSSSSTGGLTLLAHLTAGGQFADASVWVCDAGSSPVSQTITVTMSPSTVHDLGLVVLQFTGAAPAASQNGATGTSTSSATVSVTPHASGSQVVGAAGWAGSTAATANGVTSIYGQTNDSSGGASQAAFQDTSLTTSGTVQSPGFTATLGGVGMAAAEILAATTSPTPSQQPGGKQWRKKFRRRQQPTYPSPPSTQSGFLTTTAIAQATIGGTKTAIDSLTTTATAAMSAAGTKTAIVSLTTTATAQAVFGGTKIGGLSSPLILTQSGSKIWRSKFRRKQQIILPSYGVPVTAAMPAVPGIMIPGADTPGGSQASVSAVATSSLAPDIFAFMSLAGTRSQFGSTTPTATAQAAFGGSYTPTAPRPLQQPGSRQWRKRFRRVQVKPLPSPADHAAASTASITAQGSFGGTKNAAGSFTPAATASMSAAGTPAKSAALTASVTALAGFDFSYIAFDTFTASATATAVLAGTQTAHGALAAAITATVSASGTKSASGHLTVAVTAAMAASGTRPAYVIRSQPGGKQWRKKFRRIQPVPVSYPAPIPPRPPMLLGGSLSVYTVDSVNPVTDNGLTLTFSAPATYEGTLTLPEFDGTLAVNPNLLGGSLSGISLGGTIVPPEFDGTLAVNPNLLGGSLSGISLGGALVLPEFDGALAVPDFGGTDVTTANMAGTISPATLDGSIATTDYSGSATGWTMQNINLNFAEFNDITLTGTITNNGSALNLTGYTVNMYLKPLAGVVDTDGRVIKLSSGGGSPAITITNASSGAISVFIANADVQDQTHTFYRIDAVDASSHINTAIYGNITYTSL